MGIPHVIAIPYPAQGHVTPLMMLMQKIARHGTVSVTFVNTDFNHNRIVNALGNNVNDDDAARNQIKMVSIPDGLEPWESRFDIVKLEQAMNQVMPGKLEELIGEINETDDDKVSCIIADISMSWVLLVAEKMGIKRAGFCTLSAANLAQVFSIPKLLEEGIINNNGTINRKQGIYETLPFPACNIGLSTWNNIPHAPTSESCFKNHVRSVEPLKLADRIICNSLYDLEPETFNLFPKFLPVGPLFSANIRLENQAGNFWPEDSSCLQWLDQQQACSVIYVAFGSFALLEENQFQEMALGLEHISRPFLWVVRPGMANTTNEAYLKGFKERIGSRGLIVGWAPQQQVLAHPSVACFLSHCGWNSATEGISNGLPFLCSPYYSDQFMVESYICDVWKIGLRLEKDASGCIRKEEIKIKVERLLGTQEFKANAMNLKEKVVAGVAEDGCSYKNLSNIVDWIKQK